MITNGYDLVNYTETELKERLSSKEQNAASYTDKDYVEVGLCLYGLGFYESAYSAFQKAFEMTFDYADAYFYAAISLLRGQEPKMIGNYSIQKAEEYLNGALCIQKDLKYYLLNTYISYNYYYLSGIITEPPYHKGLEICKNFENYSVELKLFFQMIHCEIPEAFI